MSPIYKSQRSGDIALISYVCCKLQCCTSDDNMIIYDVQHTLQDAQVSLVHHDVSMMAA